MRKPEYRQRGSNPEPSDHVSSTLTTAPPRHDRYIDRFASAPKYSVTLARMRRNSTSHPPPASHLAINLFELARSGGGRAYALVVPTCVSKVGLRQNREWLVGGLELGVAVTRSGWPRTSMGGCSSYQEDDCAK